MADVAAKKPDPKKPVGKAKKSPLEMAEFFYSRKAINVWIFATSLLLTFSCGYMIWQDWDREWKGYQFAYMKLEEARARAELDAARDELKRIQGKLNKIRADLSAAQAAQASAAEPFPAELRDAVRGERDALGAAARNEDPSILSMVEDVFENIDGLLKGLDKPKSLATVQTDLRAVEPVWYAAKQNFEFADAELKVSQYDVREAKLHKEQTSHDPKANSSAAEAAFDKSKKAFERITTRTTYAKRLYDLMEKVKGGLLMAAAGIERSAKILAKQEEAERKAESDALRKIALFEMTLTKHIRNAPGLDFFGPPVKIHQVVIDNYLEDLNFSRVPKVDRCKTCHLGIDNLAYAAAPDGSGGVRFEDPLVQKIVEREFPLEEERRKMSKMFMAHPRPDLYVMGPSPHGYEKFGCTSCHYGDGRETEFSLAVHTPDDHEEEVDWKRRNHWHHRELWDHPMLPSRFIEATCRKCHSQQWEIPGAERYTRGMVVFERAGCYACHKTDTYPVLTKHLPKIGEGAADETQRARRPGPPLTHVKDKVSKEWALSWILSPRGFRPTTRMPHFFGQLNARGLTDSRGTKYSPQEVEAVIAASITEMLFARSKTRDYKAPPEGLTGDPKRGEALAKQVGCIACHKFEEDYPADLAGVNVYETEFAPNLANGGRKFNRTWLFHWLKDPKHYMPQSNMPSLRLTDPEALDVAEYLLSLKAADADRKVRNLAVWEEKPLPWSSPRSKDLLAHLVFEQLEQVNGKIEGEMLFNGKYKAEADRVKFLGVKMVTNFGCFSCHDIEGWEEIDGIGTELTGAQPWAKKFTERLDFGQTKFDGVNYHGTSFQDGFTDKPYRSRVTGETHVKVHHTKKDFLLHKVMEPRVYDGGLLESKHWSELLKMPNFYLSKDEAEAVATFVLSFTYEEFRGLVERVKKRPSPDEATLNRGDRIIRDSNCLACHRMALDRFEIEWKAAKDDKIVTSTRRIEGRLKAAFSLEEALEIGAELGIPKDKIKGLATYSWTSDSMSLSKLEGVDDSEYILFDGRREWYVQAGEPAALLKVLRHEGMRGGTALPQIKALKEAQNIKDEQALEARYPPMLRAQGSKTQADWLFKFLKNPWPVRPNLAPIFEGAKTTPDVNIRMPTFGFTDEEATSLVRYFWARDTIKGRETYPVTEFPMRDEAYIQANLEQWQKKAIPFILEKCSECHYIDGKAPPGGPDGAYKFAPDVGRFHDRLRPRWLDPWLEHPTWIYPGTTMTELYPDPGDRKTAIDVLMNWPRVRPAPPNPE